MAAPTSAGIAFYDRSLRYAEVQETERGFRLLRLGQCDFDFDLNRTLSDHGADQERDIISEALVEALGTSESRRLRAALHPPLCRSFFSAHDGADPVSAVSFEAGLLGFAADNSGGGIGADAAARGEDSELLHVTAIRPVVLEHLGATVANLKAEDAQAVSALRASAEVVRLGGVNLAGGVCVVALGYFDNLFELAILDESGWRFATHARGLPTPEDSIHHIREALSLMGWSADHVARALVFGTLRVPPAVEALFQGRVQIMNPLALLELDPDSLDPEYSSAEFVPSVGAALL
ncbi:MAG: hypothetical protein JJ896_12130 [Rhodothermales bacterium]|nr:hypothetical protein [Rhodothermales bacterium]MBO6780392.1 hypothetical protein [Rhodothermales bacterium]